MVLPATKWGVYHNLKESKYVVSNGDITFFFSSVVTLNKFLDGYQKYREIRKQKATIIDDTYINYDTVSDIEFYRKTEKRGFYVWLKGVPLTVEDVYQYSIRKMTEKNSPKWVRIEKPRTGERFN
jgi:hypothetical protein